MEGIKIEQEKVVTVQEVVDEASSIWKRVKSQKSDEYCVDFVYESHKEFASAYPIIVKYMQMGQFKKSAVKWFVHFLKNNPYNGHEEWLRRQSKYPSILYSLSNKNADLEVAAKIEEDVYQLLTKEANHFKESAAKIQAEVEDYDKIIKQERDREFIESLMRAKKAGL